MFIHRLTISLVRKITGKIISDDLAFGLLIYLVVDYSIALLRGLLLFRCKIFAFRGARVVGKKNCSFGTFSTLGRETKVIAYAKTKVLFGKSSKIGDFSIVSCTSSINKIGHGFQMGDNSCFGEFCYFGAVGGIVIGKNVIGGQYISFHSENHVIALDNEQADFSQTQSSGINVGDNCWIGAKATFLDGASVGNNCVVAASAVVTKKFGDNVILAGVPAKIVRKIV